MYRGEKWGGSQERGNQQQGDTPPSIRSVAPLPFEVHAIINESNEPVTLLQTCDYAGHSPSLLGVDAKGRFLIASFTEVTATDQRVVAPQTQRGTVNR